MTKKTFLEIQSRIDGFDLWCTTITNICKEDVGRIITLRFRRLHGESST